jgi:hypothetical protein
VQGWEESSHFEAIGEFAAEVMIEEGTTTRLSRRKFILKDFKEQFATNGVTVSD